MTTINLEKIVQTMKELDIQVVLCNGPVVGNPLLAFVYFRDGVWGKYDEYMYNLDKAEIMQRKICQPDYRYVQNVRDPILKLFKETKGDTTDPRWQPILEAGGEGLANKKLRYDDGKTTHLPSPFPYTLIHHFIK